MVRPTPVPSRVHDTPYSPYLLRRGGERRGNQVGIEATLKQVESPQWAPMATRGEYQIGANLTGLGTDDPDANFYENYACGSPRNYSQYCSEDVMKLFDRQSQELDPKKRLEMVIAIQQRLEQDAVRPILAQRLDYFAHWPT
jgi:ABC-type transport system substrate-binding protein